MQQREPIDCIKDWVKGLRVEHPPLKTGKDVPPSAPDPLSTAPSIRKMGVQQELPVSFTSEGAKLPGILHIPDGQVYTHRTGVIVLPGEPDTVSGPHRMLTKVARKLCRVGFACLRFDYRGAGDSEEGSANTCTRSMCEDLSCALSFLRETTGIDHVALVGLCAGAIPALTALLNDEAIEKAVLWSPAIFKAPAALPVDRNGLATPCSVLLIHGAGEPEVAVSSSYYTTCFSENNISCRQILIKGADHTFRSVAMENVVIDATVDWLKRECLHSPDSRTQPT